MLPWTSLRHTRTPAWVLDLGTSARHDRKRAALYLGAAALTVSGWIVTGTTSLSDLLIYLQALREFDEGESLYSFATDRGLGFTYPPFAGLLMWPLTSLDLPLGAIGLAWAAVILVLGVVGARILTRSAGGGRVGVVVAVTLASQPVCSAIHFGQISPLIGFLALAAPLMLGSAGFWVGVATAVKITPGAVWGVWLVRRQWGQLLLSVGTFVGVGAVAAMILPADSLRYWGELLWDSSRVGDPASLGNNSVRGLVERHAPDHAGLLWAAILLALGAKLLCAHRGQAPAVARPFEMLGLGYVAALISSPISWTHHATFVPALAALALTGATRSERTALMAGLLIWLAPVYHIASSVDDLSPQLGALVADLRPLSLIVLFVVLCRRSGAQALVVEPAPALRSLSV